MCGGHAPIGHLGNSRMAKWYRSILVISDDGSLEPLGRWLTRKGLPLLKGKKRRRNGTAAAVGRGRSGGRRAAGGGGGAQAGGGGACNCSDKDWEEAEGEEAEGEKAGEAAAAPRAAGRLDPQGGSVGDVAGLGAQHPLQLPFAQWGGGSDRGGASSGSYEWAPVPLTEPGLLGPDEAGPSRTPGTAVAATAAAGTWASPEQDPVLAMWDLFRSSDPEMLENELGAATGPSGLGTSDEQLRNAWSGLEGEAVMADGGAEISCAEAAGGGSLLPPAAVSSPHSPIAVAPQETAVAAVAAPIVGLLGGSASSVQAVCGSASQGHGMC
ncbi:hypothetical protein GPECTOR_11g233 [Gonium pectorale]|uniref:Uncharacterized protein n=1 Tax=Gonium pectorale TaxID=33097 RepID=A0A150GR26_GONPE|nr:hypothetical protein GPECTOR_11g233 [Gonium pectorale]|eukprot:KXZ51790.1 hypothetical protein GPECTOR_11g233 [Gonium pectorale]